MFGYLVSWIGNVYTPLLGTNVLVPTVWIEGSTDSKDNVFVES